jgi:hypothetical protein
VRGFFAARQCLYFEAGGFVDQFDELNGVGRIAHGAGRDDLDGLWVVALREAGEFGDGCAARGHRTFAQAGERLANTCTNARLDGLGENGFDAAGGESWLRDEELDGIAANIDDGDYFVGGHICKEREPAIRVKLVSDSALSREMKVWGSADASRAARTFVRSCQSDVVRTTFDKLRVGETVLRYLKPKFGSQQLRARS